MQSTSLGRAPKEKRGAAAGAPGSENVVPHFWAKRVAAEQALKDEIARQEQEAAKAEQAKITQAAAKPVTGKPSAGNARTAANSALPTTGDNAALAGETFVIGGVVLVAAGVFLTDKKRRQE